MDVDTFFKAILEVRSILDNVPTRDKLTGTAQAIWDKQGALDKQLNEMAVKLDDAIEGAYKQGWPPQFQATDAI